MARYGLGQVCAFLFNGLDALLRRGEMRSCEKTETTRCCLGVYHHRHKTQNHAEKHQHEATRIHFSEITRNNIGPPRKDPIKGL
mmetsp:Transcript_2386/g.8981  ORF Transcript_2386/g.8981 Transcript_2386/m.8981 type:complete len:84 (-) Transcript_2386:7213-7464(-)